jgi:hypothetical protein
MKSLKLLILFCWSAVAADLMPATNRIDWSAGVVGGIPTNYTLFASVKDAPYNAVGDGTTDDTTAIQAAITAATTGTYVYIPAGTYKLTARLSWGTDNVSKSIRGAGPKETRLVQYGATGVIKVYRTTSWWPTWANPTPTNTWPTISGTHVKGDSTLELSAVSGISTNNVIAINQINKPGLVTAQGYGTYGSWCGIDDNGTRALVQLVRVLDKTDSTLTLEKPLYWTFEDELDPRVVRVSMVSGMGVEDLAVEQADIGSYDTANNIEFLYCQQSWIKNVESINPRGAHFHIKNSYACTVRDSYLHDAQLHSSGRGYGVYLYGFNSDHLIENNIVERCRHSLIFEGGGSGCVFGYNYTKDNVDETFTWLTGDMDTHGSHPFMNLFEGNVFQKLAHDNTMGSSSHNTSFRNWITLQAAGVTSARWAVDIQQNNYYQNIVGNVIGSAGMAGKYMPTNGVTTSDYVAYRLGFQAPSWGFIDPTVPATTFIHANYDYMVGSNALAAGYSESLSNSLYLVEAPTWWNDSPWPAIGSDLTPKVSRIPAQDLYDWFTSQVPAIASQPTSLYRQVGQAATFTISASGTVPLAYQWLKGASEITDATNATYTISSCVLGDAGSYSCTVTNAYGSATSSAAVLSVDDLRPRGYIQYNP